uniref:Uncharacterized protein n=1 Tax=viral metagenome TaxID=1070528 RepID=A0A6M3LM05_9ZZZZ
MERKLELRECEDHISISINDRELVRVPESGQYLLDYLIYTIKAWHNDFDVLGLMLREEGENSPITLKSFEDITKEDTEKWI